MRAIAAAVALSLLAVAAHAEEDLAGCRDHPLFNRMPNTYINGCEASQFDLRAFPVGTVAEEGAMPKLVEVEGRVQFLSYATSEGATPASGLQIMRNFENATKTAGGTVEGRYPGWCKASFDPERMPEMGNGCMSYGLTLKLAKAGKETWVFLQASEDAGEYQMTVSEREAMKQDIAASQMADQLRNEGFVALYVNFETGSSTITADSAKTLDDAASALKLAADVKVEVGGHTDNTGTPEGNLKLSQERAQAVTAALVQRGIDAGRLTAKGYGQTVPVADNRTEDGRAKNRRVELVKK